MSCSRFYSHAVTDDLVLSLFTPTSRYKARHVTRLLKLKRSRHRIVTAQLNHLVLRGRLQHCPSSSLRYSHPLYALSCCVTERPSPCSSQAVPPASVAAPFPSQPSVDAPSSLQCLCCQSAAPDVVCLPCRHQRCCAACWVQVEQRERSVFNKHRRLKHQLTPGAAPPRLAFKPRCPVCREGVDSVMHTYMD